MSPLLRYFHALYLGAQSRWHGSSPRCHFHWRLMFESADITMLRLLEAFLKSAPQLVLQLSIMIHGNAVLPLQGERIARPLKWLQTEHGQTKNIRMRTTSRTVGEGLAVDQNSDRLLLQHHASNYSNSDNNIHVHVSDLMEGQNLFILDRGSSEGL